MEIKNKLSNDNWIVSWPITVMKIESFRTDRDFRAFWIVGALEEESFKRDRER